MSLLARLRTLCSRSGPSAASWGKLASVGVRTESDAEYRHQRINEYAAAMSDRSPKRVAELTEFLDQWVILRTSSGYVAAPGWEDEPLLTRDAHPSREDAIAYVESLGGTLRPGREQAIDRA